MLLELLNSGSTLSWAAGSPIFSVHSQPIPGHFSCRLEEGLEKKKNSSSPDVRVVSRFFSFFCFPGLSFHRSISTGISNKMPRCHVHLELYWDSPQAPVIYVWRPHDTTSNLLHGHEQGCGGRNKASGMWSLLTVRGSTPHVQKRVWSRSLFLVFSPKKETPPCSDRSAALPWLFVGAFYVEVQPNL